MILKIKDKFIMAILSQDATALHKGAESRKIYNRQTGELEDELLWDSVLHHIDGYSENNPFDFSNYTLIQCDNYSTARLLHRLIHLLSFAENGNASEDIKNKIRQYDAEFVTLIDNRLNIQDFDSWWKDIGHIILNSAADKIANMQPGISDSAQDVTNDNLILEVLRNISKMEIIVSILNKVTGKDYSYLLEKEPTKNREQKVPKYIVHNYNSDHEDNSLDNLFIVNRDDHIKYTARKISFDQVEKISLSDVLLPLMEDDTIVEDTIKQNDKWINKGKEGTHGTFKTKKAADAQRKAMFANGFSEDLK